MTIPTLLASVDLYTGKIKTTLDANKATAASELDFTVDEMTRQFEATIAEFGEPGGTWTVAGYEAVSDVAALDIDVSLANHFRKTITGATTFTVSAVPAAGKVVTFALHLVNGGSAVVQWWANINWSDGVAPVLTAAGRDIVAFTTLDGGATWDGYLLGKDMKPAV